MLVFSCAIFLLLFVNFRLKVKREKSLKLASKEMERSYSSVFSRAITGQLHLIGDIKYLF